MTSEPITPRFFPSFPLYTRVERKGTARGHTASHILCTVHGTAENMVLYFILRWDVSYVEGEIIPFGLAIFLRLVKMLWRKNCGGAKEKIANRICSALKNSTILVAPTE